MTLFERLVDSQLKLDDQTDIYLVDETEIIAMWSPKFMNSMTELLASPKKVVAIVRRRGGGFVQQVKDRPDVEIWEVTRKNREGLLVRTLRWVTSD